MNTLEDLIRPLPSLISGVPISLFEAAMATDAREVADISGPATALHGLVGRIRETVQEIRDLLRRRGDVVIGEDADRAIALVYVQEQRFAADLPRLHAAITKLLARAADATPDLLPSLRELTRVADDTYVLVLETLRDYRLSVMAERADRASGETGEIVGTPAALAAWEAELDEGELEDSGE